jgi:hypothetical protein
VQMTGSQQIPSVKPYLNHAATPRMLPVPQPVPAALSICVPSNVTLVSAQKPVETDHISDRIAK